MEKRELICIGCPLGCMISVELEGKEYAEKEVTNPMRIVTSSVRVSGGDKVSVSVKTKSDIPKGKIFDVVRDLKDVVAKAPIKIGDILVKDVAETGVDIVATANVNQK